MFGERGVMENVWRDGGVEDFLREGVVENVWREGRGDCSEEGGGRGEGSEGGGLDCIVFSGIVG